MRTNHINWTLDSAAHKVRNVTPRAGKRSDPGAQAFTGFTHVGSTIGSMGKMVVGEKGNAVV